MLAQNVCVCDCPTKKRNGNENGKNGQRKTILKFQWKITIKLFKNSKRFYDLSRAHSLILFVKLECHLLYNQLGLKWTFWCVTFRFIVGSVVEFLFCFVFLLICSIRTLRPQCHSKLYSSSDELVRFFIHGGLIGWWWCFPPIFSSWIFISLFFLVVFFFSFI